MTVFSKPQAIPYLIFKKITFQQHYKIKQPRFALDKKLSSKAYTHKMKQNVFPNFLNLDTGIIAPILNMVFLSSIAQTFQYKFFES